MATMMTIKEVPVGGHDVLMDDENISFMSPVTCFVVELCTFTGFTGAELGRFLLLKVLS